MVEVWWGRVGVSSKGEKQFIFRVHHWHIAFTFCQVFVVSFDYFHLRTQGDHSEKQYCSQKYVCERL